MTAVISRKTAITIPPGLARFRGRRPERDPLPPEHSTSEVFVEPAAVERHIAEVVEVLD